MKKVRNKILVKSTAWLTAIAMAVCMMPTNMWEAEAATSLRDPIVVDDSDGSIISAWDCVYFGHYPQSADGNGGFVKEPIKWRVLSVDGNEAFLLADKNLDACAYNLEKAEITWEKATIRSWLNGYDNTYNRCEIDYTQNNFMDAAFTSSEQAAIITTEMINADNSPFGTDGGNITYDKICLLSLDDITTKAYGFDEVKTDEDDTREGKNTAYVASITNSNGNIMAGVDMPDDWWLCSPGMSSRYASWVRDEGTVDAAGQQAHAGNFAGVRPALRLDLQSNLWRYAGTVCSNGEETEPVNINDCIVSSISAKTYTGKALVPTITIKDGSKVLVKDTDYTVSYKNSSGDAVSSPKNAGTYSVILTGTSRYMGSTIKTFTINPASISGKTATLSASSYTYNGSERKPTVTISGLKSGTDFTVTYKDSAGNAVISPINAGKYEVIITGTGNYEGILTKAFSIEEGQKPEQMERIAVTIFGVKFYVDTKTDGTATISSVAKTNKKTITIKDTVIIDGVKYKVTAIEKNAFKNCKKVMKIVIPANVKLIKKNAFAGAKELKSIQFKGKKALSIKKGAFKGLNTKKMTITLNKKMTKKEFAKAKKALKKAGFKGKIKKTGK